VHNGAAQAVLAAMRAHSTCADVQHRALFALINLATPEPQPTAATPVVVSTTAVAQGMSELLLFHIILRMVELYIGRAADIMYERSCTTCKKSRVLVICKHM
jgi:hypothetical protein